MDPATINTDLRIAVIIASVRDGRFGPQVGAWVQKCLAESAIDALREQWRAKPVAFVSYGGMAGGLRAVEALRPVFAELHAVTIRDTVSLHNPWAPADDPNIDYPDNASARALMQMMRQLLWWA